MGKKIQLSNRTKEAIKRDVETINPDRLNKEERRYWQLVVNGKNSAAKNVRFEGKYLAGHIVNVIEKVAEKKGLSIDNYLEANRDAVNSLIEKGYTETERRPDTVIDLVSNMNRKTIEMDTGNGIVRVSKEQAMQAIANLQQALSSSSTVVHIALPVKLFKNNKVRITMPYEDDYALIANLESTLDDLGIFYVISTKG